MNIIYFAWFRERLNRGSEQVAPPEQVKTVADLIDWLAGRDEIAAGLYADRKIVRVALDEQMASHDAPISGARTVAIFPPMTGG
jgi:sulfur-carrier protein